MVHEWKGTTLDGQDIVIEMKLKLHNLLDKIDVLKQVPFLVRKFIQTFITSPFVYQWIEDVTVTLVMGNEKKSISGRVFQETSFCL